MSKEMKKETLKKKWNQSIAWCEQHKELIIVFGPVLVGGFIELLKIGTKRKIVKEEKRMRESFFYDPKHRHYCETKRKLTSKEIIFLDELLDQGEALSKILHDMGILK